MDAPQLKAFYARLDEVLSNLVPTPEGLELDDF